MPPILVFIGRVSTPKLLPDGTSESNPCRTIATSGLAPGSEPRRQLVEQAIFKKHYNTNYTASWFLVRSRVLLDGSGNLKETVAGCGSGLKSRNATAVTPTVCSFTNGPVVNPIRIAPAPAAGTPREGAAGWWAIWTHTRLQDYRGFAPVHRGVCDILFADGSVQAVIDNLLNNGFQPTPDNGFTDSEIDLHAEDVFSQWSLKSQ